jgi:histidinol-phosphate aminotransferase
MAFVLLPQARKILQELKLPGPIQKHFSKLHYDTDMSNSTNPYGGEFAQYPELNQDELKKLYLKTICEIENSKEVGNKVGNFLGPKNVLFTVGSIEGIDLCLRCFCEPRKDTIVTFDPGFSAYEHWGKIQDLEIRKIPLIGEELQYVDAKEIRRLNPKMVFICNPNNPTGTILAKGLIEEICESIEGFVVVDEAYIEFSSEPSAMRYLNKYKNLIILRTLSKAWGMAGVRCGIVLADCQVIDVFRYVQIPFGLTTPSQTYIRKRLLAPQKIISSWAKVVKEREFLYTKLESLSCVKKIYKSESNFVLVILDMFEEIMEALKNKGIYVVDCSYSIPNAIKVSVSKPSDNRKFCQVLEGFSFKPILTSSTSSHLVV